MIEHIAAGTGPGIDLDIPRLIEQIEEARLAARAASLRAEDRRLAWAQAEEARVASWERLGALKRQLDDLLG